jgi:hypothetical protein
MKKQRSKMASNGATTFDNQITKKRTFHGLQLKAIKHGMISMPKLAYNLDKVLSIIRHQGIIKTGQKAANPTKTCLHRRHRRKNKT